MALRPLLMFSASGDWTRTRESDLQGPDGKFAVDQALVQERHAATHCDAASDAIHKHTAMSHPFDAKIA